MSCCPPRAHGSHTSSRQDGVASLEELFERLRSRATETVEQLEVRQRDAAIELARENDYDHVVVNETGQVERTAEEIDHRIADEHARHPERRVRI